jgi:hypothetical protein
MIRNIESSEVVISFFFCTPWFDPQLDSTEISSRRPWKWEKEKKWKEGEEGRDNKIAVSRRTLSFVLLFCWRQQEFLPFDICCLSLLLLVGDSWVFGRDLHFISIFLWKCYFTFHLFSEFNNTSQEMFWSKETVPWIFNMFLRHRTNSVAWLLWQIEILLVRTSVPFTRDTYISFGNWFEVCFLRPSLSISVGREKDV